MSEKKVIDNSKNPNLQEVYKDRKGNRWYSLKNPLEISAPRGIEAATAENYLDMNISRKEFGLAMDAHVQAAKEMDIVTCFAIVADLRHRTKFICEANSVLDLANIYYFLQDEDPEDYEEHIAEKKRAIWQEDRACRNFFLGLGLCLTKKFQNTPHENLITFMEEARLVAEKIYRYIKKPGQR